MEYSTSAFYSSFTQKQQAAKVMAETGSTTRFNLKNQADGLMQIDSELGITWPTLHKKEALILQIIFINYHLNDASMYFSFVCKD